MVAVDLALAGVVLVGYSHSFLVALRAAGR